MPIFETPQQLLEAIYLGSSVANKDKREQKTQAKNFSDKDNIEFSREFDFFGEFHLQDDPIGILGKSLISHIIRAYNKPALQFILKLHPGLVNHFFPQELHPLYQAALLNSKEMVKFLIQFGADPTQLVSKNTDTTDPRQQGLNRLFHTNSHETVESAIRANNNINKDIKTMITQAATKILDGSAEQIAKLSAEMFKDSIDESDSKRITFSNKSSDKSSDKSSSLNRGSDDDDSSGSGYHHN